MNGDGLLFFDKSPGAIPLYAAFDEALEALARRTPGTSYLSYQESDRQAEESFQQIRLLAWGLPVAAVAAGVGLAFGDGYFLMALGGFLAGMGDDALELQVEEELNRRFPSSQRATLISVSSLCFSLTMVILSPLGGFLVAG